MLIKGVLKRCLFATIIPDFIQVYLRPLQQATTKPNTKAKLAVSTNVLTSIYQKALMAKLRPFSG